MQTTKKTAKTPPPDSDGLEREDLLRRALLLPDCPTFGEIRLRPFSLWTLDLCEEIGLEVFLALPKGKKPGGTPGFQLAALLWFHDQARTEEEVDMALALGTWRDRVKAYRRAPALADQFQAVNDYVAFYSRLIGAASVRVKKKPKESGTKEEKEPASVVEPYSAFALIWSISGGQIESQEQFRFLYRGLSLPLLLSFYHCALRAALLWTVPTKAKRIDKAKREKATVVRRDLLAKEKEKAKEVDFF